MNEFFTYQEFGPKVEYSVEHSIGKVEFKLFFPDSLKDSSQYSRDGRPNDGLPNIEEIYIPGTFNASEWDKKQAPRMTLKEHDRGLLYTYSTTLKPGFYQYKFYVVFKDGTDRWVNDPCTRYSCRLDGHDNSGFVVGGMPVHSVKPRPIANRSALQELVIYEMMIDDFTKKLPGDRSQKNMLDLVTEKIDYLAKLGITALEPLPWTGVPGTGFNWGYEPFLFFSVDERLTDRENVSSESNVDRLYSLRQLIDTLHGKGIQVFMDGVFNHAMKDFPYLQLYQDPKDCPFIGTFAKEFSHDSFVEIDFNNKCAQEFILDVCKYWIETYEIDGIRFDYVLGFFQDSGDEPGITTLIRDLRQFLSNTKRENFSFILEHLPEPRYKAIDDIKRIKATGAWFDPFMYMAFNSGKEGRIDPDTMRALNANKGFALGQGAVTYIEQHDHGTLVNRVGGDFPGVDRGKNWFRTQPYAIALFTAPGTPMIHNGQEFGDEYFVPEHHKLPKGSNERVKPRPLNWERSSDNAGQALTALYKKLTKIRQEFPGLKSSFFHPDNYDKSFTRFDKDGFGFDAERQIIIFHRWGEGKDGHTERFIVVLNCSPTKHFVDVPFPFNGKWTDLLTGETFQVTDYWRKWQNVDSNYGRIFYAKG